MIKDLRRYRGPAAPRRLMRSQESKEQANLVGTNSVYAVQGLLAWNYMHVFLMTFAMVLPLGLGVLADSIRYVMLSALLCTAVSWWRLGVPVRLIWPIRCLFVVQVWLTICSFLGGTELARTNDFETSNYFLVMAVIFYFQGAIFGHLWPSLRKNIPNLILALCTISAIVGILQFLKVGPALVLAAEYNKMRPTDTLDAGRTVRAIGLASWPEWMAFQGILGWAILVSRMWVRQLKTWEFLLAGFLLMVGFMSQSRIMYVSLIICGSVFLYLLIKNDRRHGVIYLSVFLVGVLALFFFGQERMSYILSTDVNNDPALKYRRETGWVQIFHIYQERPWTGIGPDNHLVWEVTRTIPDKWTQGHYVDNGYLLLLGWGGLPALFLFMPIIFTALIGAGQVMRDKHASVSRKQVAFICFVSVFGIWNNMFLNNGFTHIYLNCLIAYMGALTLPNVQEAKDEMKRKFNVHYRAQLRQGNSLAEVESPS